MQYCPLQSSSALNFASITNHIHDWPLFSLWFYLFILSRAISPLYSSSLLWNYWSGEFIFQCPIFFPFHTVHGILKAIILKWFAFPFPSWPCFVRLSTMTHPSWVALHGMAHSFFELDKAVVHVISLVSFLWFLFFSVCPLINKDKRFMEASWWERLTWEKLGGPISRVGPWSINLYSNFFVYCWVHIPSGFFGLRSNYWPKPPLKIPENSQVSLTQSLVGTLILSPGSWCTQGFCCCFVPSKSLFPQSCVNSVIKSQWPPKSNSLGFSVSLLNPHVGRSVFGPRAFLTMWEFPWYNCSAVCGLSALSMWA